MRKRKPAGPERLKFTEKEFNEYIAGKVVQIDLVALSKKVIDEQIKIHLAKKTGKVW